MTFLSLRGTSMSLSSTISRWSFSNLRTKNFGTERVMKRPTVLTTKELDVRWFVLLMFSVLSLLVSTRSDAQDVYNFYFQKNGATAPTVTTPGTPTPAATALPPAPVNQIEANQPEKSTAPKSSIKRFEIGLARATTKISVLDQKFLDEYPQTGEGYGIQGGIRFNKFFAADFTFNVTENDNSFNEPIKFYDGALGLLITPVHINLFGYELFEISGAFGGMSGTRLTLQSDTNEPNYLSVIDQERIWGGYAGAKIAANITPDAAIAFDAKQMLGSQNGNIEMYQFSLRYRF